MKYFVPISATGSNPVTPLVMQEAVDRGYNFVFDGTEYCHKQKLTKYRSWKVSYDKLNKRWNLWREMIRIHKIDRRQI